MSEKFLLVRFSDGSTYAIPAQFIAEHRARYYASLEVGKHGRMDVFNIEVAFALADDFELTDWANNNMDWIDVETVARHIVADTVNKAAEWTSAHKWIQEEGPLNPPKLERA